MLTTSSSEQEPVKTEESKSTASQFEQNDQLPGVTVLTTISSEQEPAKTEERNFTASQCEQVDMMPVVTVLSSGIYKKAREVIAII